MDDPKLIAVAGDWHSDTRFAVAAVERAAAAGASLVVQLGDFGYWTDRQAYLRALDQVLQRTGLDLWWLDGNHDDHRLIRSMCAAHEYKTGEPAGSSRVPLTERISYLPRGLRWTWHGRTWLALGGAASVDRKARTEGWDWFAEEEISPAQAAAVAAAGPADVLLCHDAPACVPVTFGPRPDWWDTTRADAHRHALQAVVDQVKPRYVFHGHLHQAYAKHVDMPWGVMWAVCLDCGPAEHHPNPGPNAVLVDVPELTFEPIP